MLKKGLLITHPASAGLAKGLRLGPDGNFHKGPTRPGGATYGIVIGPPD